MEVRFTEVMKNHAVYSFLGKRRFWFVRLMSATFFNFVSRRKDKYEKNKKLNFHRLRHDVAHGMCSFAKSGAEW